MKMNIFLPCILLLTCCFYWQHTSAQVIMRAYEPSNTKKQTTSIKKDTIGNSRILLDSILAGMQSGKYIIHKPVLPPLNQDAYALRNRESVQDSSDAGSQYRLLKNLKMTNQTHSQRRWNKVDKKP